MLRKHIFFSGMVQGVGFRYRSYMIAQQMGLAGWVKNLWDGRVEMEIQGTAEEIEEFLRRLDAQPLIDIRHMEVEQIPCVNEGGFRMAN